MDIVLQAIMKEVVDEVAEFEGKEETIGLQR